VLSVNVRLAVGMICLAGSFGVKATPLVAIDARTTCLRGSSQTLCILNGLLTGPAGASLPSTLADLTLLTGITGETGTQFLDRSAELADGEFAAAPLVVGPQMFCSIQLSFDPRVDLGRNGARNFEGLLEARRNTRAVLRPGTPLIDSLQIELTLGSALSALESGGGGGLNARSPGKQDYVSFALVNQFHTGRHSDLELEGEEGEDEVRIE
jgi:hypothetical protein